ncbi:type VI secretion system baseplate subunit TssG, partial [Noviherbaspirillum sp.]|uniref:type VI secretion system baseplate subunit TssG n=1 Tax=Noviherbaspirillum sp. TaxID=1926288 RepID=UPI002FDF6718
YTDRQYGWRGQLVIRRDELPPLQLGRRIQLGWTTWLGRPRGAPAVHGHLLHPERETMPQPVAAPARDVLPDQRLTPQEEPCLK